MSQTGLGWVVEIDPSDPNSTPKKRTGLGQSQARERGCDDHTLGSRRGLYGRRRKGRIPLQIRFQRNSTHLGRIPTTFSTTARSLSAKFHWDGTGDWLPLTPEGTGMDAVEILVHTRMAASAVGATTMDRPEWVQVNPIAAEGYAALTNNKNRGIKPNAGGDDTSVNGPNPREANNFGQVVRWYPVNDDHATGLFRWDLFVMAGNPATQEGAYRGSSNVNEGNMFNFAGRAHVRL